MIENQVDLALILVTAGSYSDELCRQLKEKNCFTGKICVLKPSGIEITG